MELLLVEEDMAKERVRDDRVSGDPWSQAIHLQFVVICLQQLLQNLAAVERNARQGKSTWIFGIDEWGRLGCHEGY